MGRKKRISDKTASDIAQGSGDLRRVRDQAVPLLLGLFESEDEERLAHAAAALKAMNDPSLVPALLKTLRSPDVGDLAKGLLLMLLEYYGVDTCDPSLIGASIDLGDMLSHPATPQGA